MAADVFPGLLASVIGTRANESGSKALPSVDCAIGTSLGRVRDENQDRSVIARGKFLYSGSSSFLMLAVADGLGGMRAGGDCATITLAFLLNELVTSRLHDFEDRLTVAIQSANAHVYDRFHGEGGSTLSALLLDQRSGQTIIGNVGDSRVYRFAPQDVSFDQLTTDDTFEGRFPKQSSPPSRRVVDPDRSRLIQFVGIGSDLQPSIIKADRSIRDAGYLLTTDGIHDYGNELLSDIVANATTATQVTERLIAISDWMGGKDNATTVCAFPKTLERFISAKSQRSSFLTIWTPATQCEFVDTSIFLSEQRHRDERHPSPNAGRSWSGTTATTAPQAQSTQVRQRQKTSRKPRKQATIELKPSPREEKEQMKIRFLPGSGKDDD